MIDPVPPLSAGLLLHHRGPAPRVLLAHTGGPFWARKDARAWSVPKGLVEPGESHEQAARREFVEEIGAPVPAGPLVELGAFRYASGKTVVVLALEVPADLVGSAADPACEDLAQRPVSTVEVPWPPRSGRVVVVPEVDRAVWWGYAEAREKLVAGQVPVVDALAAALAR
jgi:predicted NUDIX family NTP pyrophosphohydrolase